MGITCELLTKEEVKFKGEVDKIKIFNSSLHWSYHEYWNGQWPNSLLLLLSPTAPEINDESSEGTFYSSDENSLIRQQQNTIKRNMMNYPSPLHHQNDRHYFNDIEEGYL